MSDSSLSTGGAMVLKDCPDSALPWPLLDDETLRQAMTDLSRSPADKAMDHLALVVEEIRGRGSRKKLTGDGATKSPKVAQAVADLSKVKSGKPTP